MQNFVRKSNLTSKMVCDKSYTQFSAKNQDGVRIFQFLTENKVFSTFSIYDQWFYRPNFTQNPKMTTVLTYDKALG